MSQCLGMRYHRNASELKYEIKFCYKCHSKLSIRVADLTSLNFQKLYYFVMNISLFIGVMLPINEEELSKID